nr:hypothetical protein [uncultured Flavobacterium sp.]
MKKTILFAVFCIVIQSCNSQKKDLAKITFTEKHDTFFGDIPNEYRESSSLIDYNLYDVYHTESEILLNFNGVDLSGYRDKKGEFGTNYVSFEFSKKDKILNFYSITLFYNKNVKELISNLNSSRGKPVYVSMLDMSDDAPDALLWEDKINYYMLIGATQNMPTFEVFKKQNLTICKRMFSAGSFQYYGDYLEYLEEKKKTNKQISYYQYAKLMESEGSDFNIDNYVKP